MSIGCSHKGRIWSRWVENISYWLDWCDEIGAYLLDETIDTKNILSGVLIPEVVAVRPAVLPYSIEWPQDLEIVLEERIEFHRPNKSYPYHSVDISLIAPSVQNHIAFRVANEEIEECFELRISKDDFSVVTTKSAGLTIQVGRNEYRLSEYFRDHPPIIKFIDQSSLEGNVLVKLASTPPAFNLQNIVALDWSGTDIQKESQTANRDPSSIQYRIIQDLIKENEYCIIFDDDGAGEIADIVTIKEDHGKIEFGLYHCKFSLGERPGSRIDDLYTVCGQAEKSIKWCGDPRKIIDRLIKREKDRNNNGGTRFEVGTVQKLRELQNKLRLYPATMKIAIVQPGVDSTKISQDMLQILSGTAAYLLDTYGITLKVFSS